jgi:glutathione S-transferase
MSEYRLYCFGESGNCYKAALTLALSGCDWEAVPVDYLSGETRSAAYRESVTDLGEAPALVHKGERLTQSGVILTYLAQQTGKFGGKDDNENREILRWMLFDNHKFTSYYATLRWLVGIDRSGDPEVHKFLRARVLIAFGMVEKHLRDKAFLLGDRPTIADFSLVGYHYYDEETGIDRNEFPNIKAWTGRIAALPGWQHPYDMMPRMPRPA